MSGGTSTLSTVLFTDLVGSTAIRSAIGDDAADEIRRSHDRLLADAVETNNGHVVKGLGDGIMATFPGAADAVAAGVAMQQAIERYNLRAAEVAIGVRVGISGGDVVWEDGDCFGSPVVEASRLCAAAEAGEILVSDIVRMLVGSRGGHRFTPVGDLELKGLAEPVSTSAVEWRTSPRDVGTTPLPPSLTADRQFPFAGRVSEREALTKAWKEAAAGDRRVVLIAGEPGIGKTRLAAELARDAHDQGAAVLFGRCDEELGIPYQPFVEALRGFVAAHTPTDVLPLLGRTAGELTRLAPELAELVPGLQAAASNADAETDRLLLFDAIHSWLRTISEEQPIVLVVDDLHWAGRPTLLLLRHLVRSQTRIPLLVIGTYRDTDLARTHPLAETLADFRREPAVQRMRLTGLDEPSVVAFLEAAAGHELTDASAELARAIHSETDGNPFFVGEVLFHLGESGAIAQDEDGRWQATIAIEDMPIPEGVREVVGRRVSRLSEPANAVLRCAAIIGQEFELTVLREVAELPATDVEDALEDAERAGLIREVPGQSIRYRFSHALVRSTLYEELSSARRARLHRRVLDAIERVHAGTLDEHLPMLAHHAAEAAAGGDVATAVAYARRAGDRALAQLASEEAATWYSRELDLLDASDRVVELGERAEAMIRLGRAQREAGIPAHRRTLIDAARLAADAGHADLLAAAALENNRGLYSIYGRVDEERVAILREAIDRYDPAPSATRARLLATLAIELTFSGEYDVVRRLVGDALAMAEAIDDEPTTQRILATTWMSTWQPDTARSGLELSRRLIEIAERNDDRRSLLNALAISFYMEIQLGDVVGAARTISQRARILDGIRWPMGEATLANHRSAVLYLAGRSEDAIREADRAYAIGAAAGGPEAAIIWHGARFEVLRSWRGAHDIVDEAIAEYDAYGDLFTAACTWCLVGCGRIDDARARWEPYGQIHVDERLARHHPWHFQALMEVMIASAVGDLGTCAELYRRLAPHAGVFVVNPPGFPTGAIDHGLALAQRALGDRDAARRHFADARTIYESMAAVPLLGRVLAEEALVLDGPGAREDALRAARAYAVEHDLLGIVADIDEHITV